MIRRSVISLNDVTELKKEKITDLIDNYICFEQKVINSLWNHKINEGRFVDKKHYKDIKSVLTERYKQCAAKQALANVKSQNEKEIKTKPVLRNKSLELDSRFITIEKGNNSFDIWIKLKILNGKNIYIPSKRHYHFNQYNSGWNMKKSCRLRQNKKGLFLDVFFEKDDSTLKDKGDTVGLDIGYRKLAVLSDGQVIEPHLKDVITKFYKRKKSHHIVKEHINRELKKIDFSNIKILVVEDLKNVKKNSKKKNKKGKFIRKFNRHTNRLLSNWAYRHILCRLEMLCAENRVLNAKYDPCGTSEACNQCKIRDKASRKDEQYDCVHCGWKVDADYNAALNIRDFYLAQGQYGALSKNHSGVLNG